MACMPVVEMYTTTFCPWCVRALRLLAARGVAADEVEQVNVDADRSAMVERTGRRTVPQLFIGGVHVGGFDDLAALDAEGELEPLIEAARAQAGEPPAG